MSGPAPGIAMYENTRNDPVAAWPYDTRNILGAAGARRCSDRHPVLQRTKTLRPVPGAARREDARNTHGAAWPYDARNDPRYCNVQRRSERPTAPHGSATPETSSVLRGREDTRNGSRCRETRRHPKHPRCSGDAMTPGTPHGATGRGDACTGTLTKKYHFCVQSPSFPMRAAAEAPGAPEALRSAAPQGLRCSGVTHTEVMRYMILHIPYNYMQ